MGVLSKSRWFAPIRKVYNAVRRQALLRTRLPAPAAGTRPGQKPSVLVLGIYLANKPNTAAHLVQRFAAASDHSVTQAWVALNGDPADAGLAAVTVERLDGFVPKFCIMNRLLARLDWRCYDYLLFADDDIVVAHGFLDAYLALQAEFDLALAQPARTRNSYADRKFCRQQPGLRGRRTRYVEIGPVFSVRRDFAPAILPFDETSGMGWGYDFVWPVQAEEAGLAIGIVDATPVDHSLRDQASCYSSHEASLAMRDYLDRHRHLGKQQAFTVTAQYP